MSSRLLASVVLSAALVSLPTSSRGQGGVSTDPVLARMWTLGMDSSHTWDLSQTFFDSIGPRLSGTPQGLEASDWVMKMYRSWGIDTHREKYGTWRGWKRGYSHIDLVKPRVRTLEATILGDSPGTGGKNVTGTTIVLPMVKDSNEFVKWLPNAKGKFVLISPAYPTCRPEEEWAAMATPASKARMDSTVVNLVNDWTTRIRNTGYPVTAGNPTGNLGMRIEKAGAARRDRVELRQRARRGVGHVHGLRHQEQDRARHRDELRGLRPSLSADRAAPGSAVARERRCGIAG